MTITADPRETPVAEAAPRLAAFLTAAGRGGERLKPLAGDASNRRYLRVTGPLGPAVLMDAPPERGEDVRPFLAVTHWLRGEGLSAPEIYASDAAEGLLLIEDLGDALFARAVVSAPAAEDTLYGVAVDLLAALPERGVPERVGAAGQDMALRPYDAAEMAREACLVLDWYLAGGEGAPVAPSLPDSFRMALAATLADLPERREALVLRDYHAENLIWLPEREGHARIGLLDYQDALAGPAAYDLVSLLEDARRDTSPALRAAMMARYCEARGLAPEAVAADCARLGAQRNLKILGIFARLALRDGKPRYLSLLARVWAHLARDLAHPACAPLEAWCAAHLPPPTPALLARIEAGAPAP